MDVAVFVISALIILGGALGVVLASNPVHSALSLVAALFGTAVLFVQQHADFLAAVQVIVYAGAIVVLFLFVIMLLGVDRTEDLESDPLVGQRPAAIIAGIGILGLLLVTFFITYQDNDTIAVGAHSVVGPLGAGYTNVERLGTALFTDYLFAFEITSALLVIAVVGAVVLARRTSRSLTSGANEIEGTE
jgi:NADH-quinone oxidoreductase subunit J